VIPIDGTLLETGDEPKQDNVPGFDEVVVILVPVDPDSESKGVQSDPGVGVVDGMNPHDNPSVKPVP